MSGFKLYIYTRCGHAHGTGPGPALFELGLRPVLSVQVQNRNRGPVVIGPVLVCIFGIETEIGPLNRNRNRLNRECFFFRITTCCDEIKVIKIPSKNQVNA